ncbi:hypothetical protein Xen7305DRAFT_00024300 [Xenococcus sp. PCC 7305]|uniref:DUF6753 family protein n=1 Tax=Xenococcus sp. PCC 7305 TaxID=102125 RepID=UPI0002ABB932|nr:DUF6753 family protein [Xenococcus sp. PCC 7305]ELS02712.1 hypothetical protein Xen7305DRAFT_00024300 [Xenococcus sp. PCC 7305]
MHNNGQQSLLDTILEGKSDQMKARVLEIVIKYGINQDDEAFFLIFVALGYLQVLLETSPVTLEQTFVSFHHDLKQWTTTNLRTLETFSQATSSFQQNQILSQELTTILTKLVEASLELTSRIQKLEVNSVHYQDKSNNLEQTLTKNLSDISAKLKAELIAIMNAQKPKKANPIMIWGSRISLVVIMLLSVNLYWQISQLKSAVKTTEQNSSWVLEKSNRWDCRVFKLKNPQSPECQGIQN